MKSIVVYTREPDNSYDRLWGSLQKGQCLEVVLGHFELHRPEIYKMFY